MNNYEKLEGMVAATFTPLDENGDVNLSVIDKYADWIASTPIKGYLCAAQPVNFLHWRSMSVN